MVNFSYSFYSYLINKEIQAQRIFYSRTIPALVVIISLLWVERNPEI